MDASLAASVITLLQLVTAAVPPDACFQDFRWEDCGKEPKAVMYYWKPGSRCEVGIWRGCRPSFNMFKDEYECVSTCIFTVRAHADDFHNLQMLEEEPVTESEESDYEEDSTNTTDDGVENTNEQSNDTTMLSDENTNNSTAEGSSGDTAEKSVDSSAEESSDSPAGEPAEGEEEAAPEEPSE